MLKNISHSLINFTDSILNKFGYKQIFIGLTAVSVLLLLASYMGNFSLGFLNIVSFISDLIFIVGLYYLALANIKTYFYFFIYFLLKSYISLQGLFSMLDLASITALLVIIIVMLSFLLHGLYKWGAKNYQGNIIPTRFQSYSYLILMAIYLVVAVILGVIVNNLAHTQSIYSIVSIFSLLNLITAIILINEKKREGLIFLIGYFIVNLIVFRGLFFIQELFYVILIIFAYKHWNYLISLGSRK